MRFENNGFSLGIMSCALDLIVGMAKRAGQVKFGSSQLDCGSKTGHFKRVKNGFGLIGLWVGSS